MDLDRALSDEPSGARDLHFRRRDTVRAGARVGLVLQRHRREVGHRPRQLELAEHLGHAVLQRLERTDRHPELLALFGVVDRRFEHDAHQAETLGAQRGDRVVEPALEQREARARRVEPRRRVDPDAVEADVGDVVAVFGAERRAVHVRRIRRHEEERYVVVGAR